MASNVLLCTLITVLCVGAHVEQFKKGGFSNGPMNVASVGNEEHFTPAEIQNPPSYFTSSITNEDDHDPRRLSASITHQYFQASVTSPTWRIASISHDSEVSNSPIMMKASIKAKEILTASIQTFATMFASIQSPPKMHASIQSTEPRMVASIESPPVMRASIESSKKMFGSVESTADMIASFESPTIMFASIQSPATIFDTKFEAKIQNNPSFSASIVSPESQLMNARIEHPLSPMFASVSSSRSILIASVSNEEFEISKKPRKSGRRRMAARIEHDEPATSTVSVGGTADEPGIESTCLNGVCGVNTTVPEQVKMHSLESFGLL